MLPYDTPAPADLDKLMSGELVSPPRLKNPSIPKSISDIVMKAMAPETTARYQRAADLLDDVLAARNATRTPAPGAAPRPSAGRAHGSRRCAEHPEPAAGARRAGRAVLLALPQAAARANGSLSVLRRGAVGHGVPYRTGVFMSDWICACVSARL